MPYTLDKDHARLYVSELKKIVKEMDKGEHICPKCLNVSKPLDTKSRVTLDICDCDLAIFNLIGGDNEN